MEKILMFSEKKVIDDRSKMSEEKRMLQNFLISNMGRKNLLVIRVSDCEEIQKELETFSSETNRGYILFDGTDLVAEKIRGLSEMKDTPHLIAVQNLHAVRNLDTLEEAAVFRAIIDMADPGNAESGMHKDSSFVLLAEDDFPSQEMASISLTWAYETAFLDCRDFRTKAMIHMKNYKEKFLRLKEDVNLKGRSYENILPEKHYELNFSTEVREKLISSKYLSTIKWHRFSHHLNSSQVMAVNFFYPLIKHRELDTFIALAGIDDEVVYDPSHILFTKMSHKENTDKRKTCFDLFLKLKSGREVFVKVRYTDGGYGRALHEDYGEKYREVYQPLLNNSSIVKEEYKGEEYFLENYNVMRSLAHLDENSNLIVIYPRENWRIRDKALTVKDEILTPDNESLFIPMVWEDLIELMMVKMRDNDVARYYDSWFKDKYFRY